MISFKMLLNYTMSKIFPVLLGLISLPLILKNLTVEDYGIYNIQVQLLNIFLGIFILLLLTVIGLFYYYIISKIFKH